jgi:hypothetical protein
MKDMVPGNFGYDGKQFILSKEERELVDRIRHEFIRPELNKKKNEKKYTEEEMEEVKREIKELRELMIKMLSGKEVVETKPILELIQGGKEED